MELQWPLILFTTLIAWSAGVFATQGILVVCGRHLKAHLPLLVTSLVLMAIGGIAVFMHLEHWERIFNGFGHLSSGITQELIGIVLMVAVMVLLFAQLRQRADGTAPAWCGWAAIAIAAVLVVAMGHSYMMPSRPAWDSVLQVCSLLGAGCIMGPATAAVVLVACGDDPSPLWRVTFAGALVNAVVTLAYLLAMSAAQGGYTSIGYYFDPTQIARGMIDFEGATGLLADGRAPLVILVVVLCVLPVVLALLLRDKKRAWADAGDEDEPAQGAQAASATGGEAAPESAGAALGANSSAGSASRPASPASAIAHSRWAQFGIAMSLSAFFAALLLRVVFYELGHTVYIFF